MRVMMLGACLALVGCAGDKKVDKAAVTETAATSSVAGSFVGQPPVGTKARCAVTGEEFVVSEKTVTATYGGRVYAFCCGDCKPTFDKDPAKYASR